MVTIIIRNSTGSGVTPSSLVQGELAINTVDGKLFYGSGSGNVVKEFTGSGGSGGSTNTGSLLTTASFSNPNLTFTKGDSSAFNVNLTSLVPTSASFATSSSYAANGGVTQLLAGPNITLSPIDGKGQVTVSSTAGGGGFNTATGSYGSFYDTTTQTNPVANVPRSMSFDSTDITNGVSISGSTNPFNTYIKTENAGVYNIQFSAQVDKTDGGTDDIVIWLRKNGIDLTDTATTLTLPTNNSKVVAAWNWFVTSATGDYYQIIWLSADTDLRLLAEPISGTHPGIPSIILTVNRVDQFLSNTGSFSGSFNGSHTGLFSGSFTGSLLGTSSAVVNSTFINSTTRRLFNSTNYIVFDWQNGFLNDSTEVSSLDINNRIAYDPGGAQTIDWGNATLTDLSSGTSIDWNSRRIYDSLGQVSLNYNSRVLYYSDSTTALNYNTQGQVLITGGVSSSGGFTGSLQGTASYATVAQTLLGSVTSASYATTASYSLGPIRNIQNVTDGTAVTGTISSTLTKSILIPANTVGVNDVIYIKARARKTGTAGTLVVRMYINTSAAIGGSLIATSATNASPTLYHQYSRTAVVKSTTNTETMAGNGNVNPDDNTALSFAVSTSNIDWTVDQYLVIAHANGSTADSSVNSFTHIQINKG